MNSSSPCLRVSVVKRKRRGQTLIIALAILFLLVLLGGTFITMVMRNVQRVARHGETDEALTQALAGLQFAANQFRTSELGADWRPRTSEQTWRDPVAANAATQQARNSDYDSDWLDPLKTNGFPYVRVPNGRGHFLLRVTYAPSFKQTSATAGKKDEFDQNSGFIHVESVGRWGEIDPNDPTTTRQPDPTEGSEEKTASPAKPFRKVEAWVPIGLTDQLWWITNNTGERGPANLGAPPITNPTFDPNYPRGEDNNNYVNRQYVSFPALFEGGVRSDVDLNINGTPTLRVYPSRGDALVVKGNITVPAPVNNTPQVFIQVVDDDQASAGTYSDGITPARPILPGDDQGYHPGPFSTPGATEIDKQPLLGSTDANFAAQLEAAYKFYNLGKDARYVVQDEAHARTDQASEVRSTRQQKAPNLEQVDATSGVSRWLRATRDSGKTVQITDGAVQRVINTGWYGLTDSGSAQFALPPDMRAKGLYLDNFGDIQHPEDRRKVKDDWLRRGSQDLTQRGWIGDYYIPTAAEGGTAHPVAEIYLTQKLVTLGGQTKLVPVIRITRYDMDQRQMNLGDAAGKRRMFYERDPQTGIFAPAVERDPSDGKPINDANGNPIGRSFTRDFDYPDNGIVYCEGSVRVHGVIGATTDGTHGGVSKQLTIVSGGTVYIEGNIVKPIDSGGAIMRESFLGLFAHDFVTLNPTAFQRVQPGNDVVIERDPVGPDQKPGGYHFVIPQGGDLDFAFSASESIDKAMILLKHTAKAEDASAETAVNIFLPAQKQNWPDWFNDRFDVRKNNIFNVESATPPSQLYYLFHQILPPLQPGVWSTNPAETSNQTSSNSPSANYEYKALFPNTISSDGSILPRGLDATYRMLVGYKDTIINGQPAAGLEPNGQPYWLSRVAVIPHDRPLPIKVEAVMYAYTGSWFVIPPPFFNDNPLDTRASWTANGKRAAGTFPHVDASLDADHFLLGDAAPFHNEALNIDVDIHGSITENMPAEPAEVALWTSRMWVQDYSNYDPTALPLDVSNIRYRPYIHYRYDDDLKRMVRGRLVKDPTQTAVLWTAPGAPPAGLTALNAYVNKATTDATVNSYVETLPILPGLPSSALIYEGNPL